MLFTVKVKSANAEIKAQREAAAWRVIGRFANHTPDPRLLCFFDDDDWKPFKNSFGTANRGFYKPLSESPLPGWPDYLRKLIFVRNPPPSSVRQLAFDHVIYLHGSTRSNLVGLTITLAHELQHFVQHSEARELWAANTLIPTLSKSTIEALKLRWCDIPHEREAKIVSKQTAEEIFGAEVVRRYIEAKIREFITESDASDWKCIRELSTSNPYDLAHETKVFFSRLKAYRQELEQKLQELQSKCSDFTRVELDTLFRGNAGSAHLDW